MGLDYPRNEGDPFQYARELFEKIREYIDKKFDKLIEKIDRHNKHRIGAIETVGEHAAQSLADLHRGSARPGWVQITFDQHKEDIDEIKRAMGEEGWIRKAFNANAESINAQNKKLNAIFVAVGLMLLSLLGNLVAIIVGVYK